MPTLSGIYDSYLLQPIAKVKENLSVLTTGVYQHYRVEYLEGMPPGPANVVDMVAQAGLTTLVGGGTITKRIVTILQLNDLEFLHLRWEPLDNVEGVLWELAGQARFNTANIQARVDLGTKLRDPYLSTTTFWILGRSRDMNLEVRNPMARATPTARFMFWGFRHLLSMYYLTALAARKTPDKNRQAQIVTALKQGDQDIVRELIGVTTWLPAEGRQG